MKKSTLSGKILTIILSCLLLSGCGKDDPSASNNGITLLNISDNNAAVIIREIDELSAPADNTKPALPMTEGMWKKEILNCGLDEVEPYRELIESDLYLDGFSEGISQVQFGLIYFDSDDLPELVILDREYHITPVKIYSIGEDGIPVRIITSWCSWGSFSYMEKTGVFDICFAAQGCSVSHYVKADKESAVYLGSDYFNSFDNFDGAKPAEYRIEARLEDEYIRSIEEDRDATGFTENELADEGRLVEVNEYISYLLELYDKTKARTINYKTGSDSGMRQNRTGCLKAEAFLAYHEPGVELYRSLIESGEALDGFSIDNTEMHYGLFFLDADNTPELAIVDGDYHVGKFKIYSIGPDGKPIEIIMCAGEFGALTYAEKQSLLELCYGNQGYFRNLFLKANTEGINVLGMGLEDGSRNAAAPEGIDYIIDIPLSDELLHEIQSNKRYFAGGWNSKVPFPENGTAVSEEEFVDYGRDIMQWRHDVILYRY